MRLRRPSLLRLRIGPRFAVTVSVLVVMLMALGGVVAHGLEDLRDANRGLRTAVEETSLDGRLRAELMDFKGKLQLHVTTSDPVVRAALREEIEERITRIDADFVQMRRRYATSSRGAELTARQERPYRVLRQLWRSGAAEVPGSGPAVDARKRVVIRAIRREVKPLGVAAQALAERDVELSQAAAAAAESRFAQTWTTLAVAIGLLTLCSIAACAWLVNSIVPRTRRYARFAAGVATGEASGRIAVEGADELAELGHTLNEMVLEREAERDYEETQIELTETLQVAADEAEANGILKLHLERYVNDSGVVILNRNNSADRLEARTEVELDSALAAALEGAVPRDCLAVRFVRPNVTGGARRRPLLSCELCGGIPGTSTCSPLTVGGEVIGSVLVSTPAPLSSHEEHRVKASVAQAAPVLGNLRNLAISELRAATDSLTGLPNNRSVRDTVKRMTAQASRSTQAMGAALLDLDHFKQINDTYGHGRGDEVLAAVGAVLRQTLRQSDFAGRAGGEEFVLLFPDTGAEGVLVACEKIRAAIAQIVVPGVEREITASIGIALVPDHAGGADDVLRAADRALYSAKEQGRNRVLMATPSDVAKRRDMVSGGTAPAPPAVQTPAR